MKIRIAQYQPKTPAYVYSMGISVENKRFGIAGGVAAKPMGGGCPVTGPHTTEERGVSE